MKVSFRLIAVTIFALSMSVGVSAQKTDDSKVTEADKIKAENFVRLLEDTFNNAASLKLPENRAVAFAKLGNFYWQIDEKRARALFNSAVDELINAQTEIENDSKNAVYFQNPSFVSEPRQTILYLIGSRDGELALQLMEKSRPVKLVKIMAKAAEVSTSPAKINNKSYDRYFLNNEKALAEQLNVFVANQNPERAAKILRDTLRKGFSSNSFETLQKLWTKDPKVANALAAELTEKVLQSNFEKYGNNFQFARSMLQLSNDKTPSSAASLEIDANLQRALAEKVTAHIISISDGSADYYAQSVLPSIEKFLPARAKQIKQIIAKSPYQDMSESQNPEYRKLLQTDVKPETMIAAAEKFPSNLQGQIISSAADKIAESGDYARAQSLLESRFSDEELESQQQNLALQAFYRAINKDDYATAENIIGRMRETAQINSYLELAGAVYKKNPKENRNAAIALLVKARTLTPLIIENSQEMSSLINIISGYAKIEPEEAFSLLDSIIPQINDLSEAAAKINQFEQNSGNIRRGEFLISQNYRFRELSNALPNLAKIDLERAIKSVNGFGRLEIRVGLQLQIAESLNIKEQSAEIDVNVKERGKQTISFRGIGIIRSNK